VRITLMGLLGALCAGTASAAEQIVALRSDPGRIQLSDRVIGFSSSWTDTITINFDFPRFDPARGQLIEVQASFDSGNCMDLIGQFLSQPPSTGAGLNANSRVVTELTGPGLTPPPRAEAHFNESSTPRPPPLAFTLSLGCRSGSSDLRRASSASLSSFRGSGTARLPLRITYNNVATISNTGMQCAFRTDLDVTARVTYRYRPACQGDWNDDGVIDFNDLLAFLNSFNLGDVLADLNEDSIVDFNDLLAFLNRYNSSC